MDKIVIYQKCAKYQAAKKLLKEGVIPLSVKVDNEEEKMDLLKSGYYRRLETKIEPNKICNEYYLIYNYKRNFTLKQTYQEPEISKILYKDKDNIKRVHKNIKFNPLSTVCYALLTNLGNYNLEKMSKLLVNENIKQFKDLDTKILEKSCNLKEANKYIEMGIYPLYIKNNPSNASLELDLPYIKEANGWKLDTKTDIYFHHLIRIENKEPNFYEIEDRCKEIFILDNGLVYDANYEIKVLKARDYFEIKK